jgi:hypothetical protein
MWEIQQQSARGIPRHAIQHILIFPNAIAVWQPQDVQNAARLCKMES